MKKTISLIISAILLVTMFVGCKADSKGKGSYKIGIVQPMEHTSLDEIRESFIAEVEKQAKEKGIVVEFDYKNAQGDFGLIQTLARTLINNKVDVIVAIATPSAQGVVTETKDIPIIFSAVTDPVAAGLLTNMEAPEGNVTGTSDAIDVEKIFNLAFEITPDVKSFGLIYNMGEANSEVVINQVKTLLDSKGIAYSEKTVGNAGEVQQAARSLAGSNDAIFAPIDNTVAEAMQILAKEANAQKVPVYVAADSMVIDGGLATAGISYTELGQRTAGMTIRVLTGTPISEIPVEVMTETSPMVNEETAKEIGVDVSKYVK